MESTVSIKLKIIGGILFFIGIAFLIGAVVFAIETISFINESIQVEGIIVDVEREWGGDKSPYPIIQFVEIRNGKTIVFKSNTSKSQRHPCVSLIGTKVPVRYLPEEPEKARMDTFFGNWGWTIILGIFGVVFAGLGFGGLKI